MKKVIISTAVALILLTGTPALALQYPLTEGYDGITENINDIQNSNCVIRRIGYGLPYSQFPVGKGINWCDSNYTTIKRLYALEQSVIELQSEIEKQNIKIERLERNIDTMQSQVNVLENLFNKLKTILLQVVQMLISIKK